MTAKKPARSELSIAHFANTGRPADPFRRAMLRTFERIEAVLAEEFILVLNEETLAAHRTGFEEGLKAKHQAPRKGGPLSHGDLRRLYPRRKR